MGERSKIEAAVKTRQGTTTINGEAVVTSEQRVRIMSRHFIPPGTSVDALLFFDEPERVPGRIGWAMATPGEDRVMYTMGFFVHPGMSISNGEFNP